MASNIQFTLDTQAPASVVLTAPANSGSLAVSVSASTTDTDTTGYTMKFWGTGVSADVVAGTTKANAPSLAFTTAQKTVTFVGEGSTTLNLAVYDDVGNETLATPVTINIVTSLATVTVSNISGGNTGHTKFSTTSPYNVLTFNFTSSMDYTEYKVLRVSTTGSLVGTGIAITTTNGSTNVGAVESVTAGTPKTVTINMLDLPTQVNELKIIKVFVKNVAGNWSEA
jgi:hypothetical protein